jgi:hypothetical protein
MFLLFVVVISLGVALARGGNLEALGQVRIRYAGVLLIALFFKALVYSTVAAQYLGSGPWNRIGHVLVNLTLLAVVFANRKLPGFWLVGLGIAANLLVILANGGAMPVSVAGAQRLGLPTDPLLFHQQYGAANSLVTESTHLWFLGDVIVMPPFLPAKVISIGDAALAIGAFIFFQKVLVGSHPAQTLNSPTATSSTK